MRRILVCLLLTACAEAIPEDDEPLILLPQPEPAPSPEATPDPAPRPLPDPQPAVEPEPEPEPDPNPATPSPWCTDASYDRITAAFDRQLTADSTPGGALVIVCDGAIVRAHTFGVRRPGGPAVTRQTRFQFASTTKMFTAATAVRIASADRLDLDARIDTYIENAGFGAATLREFLTHTSGFPTDFADNRSGLREVVSANRDMQLWAPAGAVWNYSNPGFTVVGGVLANEAGRAFPDLVQDAGFRPAGMTRATFDVAAILADGDFAHGRADGIGETSPDWGYFPTGYYQPMGGAWGTAEDLARWGIAHIERSPAVLDAAGWVLLQTAASPTVYPTRSYALGHFVDAGLDPVIISHDGGAPGFIAQAHFSPSARAGLFSVVNADDGWFDLSAQLFDWLAPQATRSWPDSQPPAALAGTYVDPGELGRVIVRPDNRGGLEAHFADLGLTVGMDDYGEDIFLITVPQAGFPVFFRFWPGDDGAPRYLASIFGVATRQ